MTQSLLDKSGARKYLVASERKAFVSVAAMHEDDGIAAFCLTLAVTGARISEVLALTPERVDVSNSAVVFETLKQRKKGVFRAVPVTHLLLRMLIGICNEPRARLWPWGRTTAWKLVKRSMLAAEIPHWLCKPKALRHAFAVEAGQHGVQLHIVQRWLGHARLETTVIYSSVLGEEERVLAGKTWECLTEAMTRPDKR